MMRFLTCADNGVSGPERVALGVESHNWGSWSPHDIPLISLKPGAREPTNWAQMLMIGNEPQNPDLKAGDGYCGRAWEAGVKAAALVIGRAHASDVVAGNFFAGSLNKARCGPSASCYTGDANTKSAGPEYWNEFRDGWFWRWNDVINPGWWGIHWYERDKPPKFDWPRCRDVLAEFVEWAHPVPVAITEFGIEEWGWEYTKGRDFMDKAVDWCANNGVDIFTWCQWPSRWATAGLWRSNKLTPLGVHYRDLVQRYRNAPPEPEEPEPSLPNSDKWQLVSRHEFEVPPEDELYRVTVERLLR